MRGGVAATLLLVLCAALQLQARRDAEAPLLRAHARRTAAVTPPSDPSALSIFARADTAAVRNAASPLPISPRRRAILRRNASSTLH